jgi:hypothetical protein
MVRVANGTATEEDVSGLNPHVPSARTAEYNDRNLNLNIFPSPPHPRAPASGKKFRFFLSFGRSMIPTLGKSELRAVRKD